jgi:lipoyl(octanoyl) transferase
LAVSLVLEMILFADFSGGLLDVLPPLLWFHSDGKDPGLDLAREEALLESAVGSPFLLTWSWEKPVLVLGYAQGLEGIDPTFCRREGIPILRRCSGGTGVIHRGDLSASLALPPDHSWASGIRSLYQHFTEAFRELLAGIGVSGERPVPTPAGSRSRSPICFEDRLAETILSEGRKVLGCAQARRAAGILVHGTLLLSENSSLYSGVFHVPGERVRSALGPIRGVPHSGEALAFSLGRVFARDLNCELKEMALPVDVEAASQSLIRSRRSQGKWHPVAQG